MILPTLPGVLLLPKVAGPVSGGLWQVPSQKGQMGTEDSEGCLLAPSVRQLPLLEAHLLAYGRHLISCLGVCC